MRKTRRLVKDRLAKGLETEVVFTPDNLEDLLAATASLKNRGGNRGRFTPYQLVIGQNPRVPHELLSDDPADEVGMQELIRDNADPDSPAKALKHQYADSRPRTHADGDRHCKRTIEIGGQSSAPSRPNITVDSGYVWRKDLRGARDRTGGPALSRWVRRGLVALQDGTTVWASMRGRLWKCARKQMREATNHESFGAEFLTLNHL